MIAETIPAIGGLTADQKIILAAELWRDAVGVLGETPNPELVQTLVERLDYHKNHPNEAASWDAVRARIASSVAR